MKVVNAVWEKRNLGVDCVEISIDHKDTVHEVEVSLNEIGAVEYMVARIPSERIDVVQLFQAQGYEFIEAAVKLNNNLRKTKIPEKIMRVCKNVAWEAMNKEDLRILYSEVRKNIFKTDRIILDPYFTAEQAAKRYQNWIKDLVEMGETPYKVKYNGQTVGFFLNKEIEPGTFDGILAGTYSDYEGSGMGVCVQYAGIEMAKRKNAQRYIGHVSANNPAVLKSLELIGFETKLIEYILIKHN